MGFGKYISDLHFADIRPGGKLPTWHWLVPPYIYILYTSNHENSNPYSKHPPPPKKKNQPGNPMALCFLWKNPSRREWIFQRQQWPVCISLLWAMWLGWMINGWAGIELPAPIQKNQWILVKNFCSEHVTACVVMLIHWICPDASLLQEWSIVTVF